MSKCRCRSPILTPAHKQVSLTRLAMPYKTRRFDWFRCYPETSRIQFGSPFTTLVSFHLLTRKAGKAVQTTTRHRPHPWAAEETNDGDTNETSWTHPSTNLLLPTVHKLDFLRHHASYTWGTMENLEMAYVVEPGIQGNEGLQRWRSIKTSPLLFDISGPQSQQRLHRSIPAELRIF